MSCKHLKHVGVASLEYTLLIGLILIATTSGLLMLQNTGKLSFNTISSQLGATSSVTTSTPSTAIVVRQTESPQPLFTLPSVQPTRFPDNNASVPLPTLSEQQVDAASIHESPAEITGSSVELNASDALQVKRPRQIVADANAVVNQSGLFFTWRDHNDKKRNQEEPAADIESIADLAGQHVIH